MDASRCQLLFGDPYACLAAEAASPADGSAPRVSERASVRVLGASEGATVGSDAASADAGANGARTSLAWSAAGPGACVDPGQPDTYRWSYCGDPTRNPPVPPVPPLPPIPRLTDYLPPPFCGGIRICLYVTLAREVLP